MAKPRRKKILLFISLLLILILAVGYFFRFPLILTFQSSRIRSLDCPGKATGENDCTDRIWVHRVNSVNRYKALEDKFSGFETDIVYNNASGTFSVYHPPLEPGDSDTLSLADFFQATDLLHKKFWLDTRFVDAFNKREALAVLTKMNNADLIRKACIIELYDAEAAQFFAEQGYTVSFNMPLSLQAEFKKNVLLNDSLERILEKVHYISQEASYLGTMKNLFPAKKIITWDPHFSNFFNKEHLQKLLNDPQVAIVLVNIKSKYYR